MILRMASFSNLTNTLLRKCHGEGQLNGLWNALEPIYKHVISQSLSLGKRGIMHVCLVSSKNRKCSPQKLIRDDFLRLNWSFAKNTLKIINAKKVKSVVPD